MSADVDYSHDQTLTIPEPELHILNSQNWYENPSREAWEIANKYFQVAFIGFFPEQIRSTASQFSGTIILRAFGLSNGLSYSQLLRSHLGHRAFTNLERLEQRFWFGAGYDHLSEIEDAFLQERNCFLPVGLAGSFTDRWTGDQKKILFVCPRIGTSPYYRSIYEDFKRDFKKFDYVIGGAQPIPVSDRNVTGYVPRAAHDRSMKECAVMFYHSRERYHVHYHPFEAIQAGMPLVFMAGGLLDKLGGAHQPGRCESIAVAQEKVGRILKGDRHLIDSIRASQLDMLLQVSADYCQRRWRDGFSRVLESVVAPRQKPSNRLSRRKKIAVIVPVNYRGGTLRAAKLLAQTLLRGAQLAGENVDIVFGHIDDPQSYSAGDFDDLDHRISRRPFKWRDMDVDSTQIAMKFAGFEKWQADETEYQIPDDGIKQFLDCDGWIFVSDRVLKPVVPIRPYLCVVYDYLQRYEPVVTRDSTIAFIQFAQRADKVLVTTEFTRRDALQYAGVSPRKVKLVPMLVPDFSVHSVARETPSSRQFFLWPTNLGYHKNHRNALQALFDYYVKLEGTFDCEITGVNSAELRDIFSNELKAWSKADVEHLEARLKWNGELSEEAYRSLLKGSQFVFHPTKVDNGTFAVIEAAALGVPSLSSDYPAMREIDQNFDLQLNWMDSADPTAMAQKIRWMEDNHRNLKLSLRERKISGLGVTDQNARSYWEALGEWL